MTQHTPPVKLGAEEIEHRFGFHKATIEGDNATLPKHRAEQETVKTEMSKETPAGPQVSGDGNFTTNLLPSGALEVSPRPWEGPAALVIRPERASELIDLLKQYT